MPHKFSRQELYDLVWSEPMKTLAARFNLSDVGLAKACKKANIPRPPRGYWAKLAAGKRVSKTPLPARGPGMSDSIEIGANRYYYYSRTSEEEALNSTPQPPVFEDTIEDVAARVTAAIPRVTVPRFPEHAHRQIRQLLDADELRRREHLTSRFPSSWNAPLFDEPFEKRRLRVLNAIMTALEKAGMKPTFQGKEGRDLGVHVNDTLVRYTLDATSQKPDPYRRSAIQTRGSSARLRCQILTGGSHSGVRLSWEDSEKEKLETHLTAIVTGLIIAGEQQYREACQWHYEWMVGRKAALIEKTRKRKEEAERKERERLAALEKARLDRLLGAAAAFRQATDIRVFVANVESRQSLGALPISDSDFATWKGWALSQADQIDPVQSGRFIKTMADQQRSPNGDDT
jgi:hypothetical protein